MATKKTTKSNPIKKSSGKPATMKEVVVSAKRIKSPDSIPVGYGAGKKNFAVKDLKAATKAGLLKGDTTNYKKMASSFGGNSSKKDQTELAIARMKKKK